MWLKALHSNFRYKKYIYNPPTNTICILIIAKVIQIANEIKNPPSESYVVSIGDYPAKHLFDMLLIKI